FSLPVAFGLPAALCLLIDIRLFPLVRDRTDGWYSLADAAGADDDGVSGIATSWSSRTYVLSLARFCALPAFASSTDRYRPLLLVVVDDGVDARLGALRLGGSERVIAGAWIDLWSPFGSRVDWRIDSPIAPTWVVPTAKPSIVVSSPWTSS
ncbi:hypothetical protein PENSOL_c326G01913, partial [Penicillium solitum]